MNTRLADKRQTNELEQQSRGAFVVVFVVRAVVRSFVDEMTRQNKTTETPVKNGESKTFTGHKGCLLLD